MSGRRNQLCEALLDPTIGLAFAQEETSLLQLTLQNDAFQCHRLGNVAAATVPALYAVALTNRGSAEWPSSFLTRSFCFSRIMDRLYVLTPRERNATIAVFDACASAYEHLIDRDRNIRNITRLLNTIDTRCAHLDGPLRILDFGCGTALSLEAIAQHPTPRRFVPCGLDASPHMRAIAVHRGLQLCIGSENQSYDGIIASYVLHGCLEQFDWELIATSLKDRGVFVGNWLHGENAEMGLVLQCLATLRLGNGELLRDENLWPRDPLVAFQTNAS